MPAAKILIVEDEGIVAKDLQNRLRRVGYDVPKVATSGEQAIEGAQALRPDLVLMDIMLQGAIDGIEAARELRNRFEISVIYLTAYADNNTLQRAKTTAPHGYLIKPFKDRELYATIEMAIYRNKLEKNLKESNHRLESALNEIKRIQQHIIKQERLRALGEMASGIAHDFNNALAPVVGIAELLLLYPKCRANEQQLLEHLQLILTAAKDATSIVARLREFYRNREDSGEFVSVDIRKLVEQVILLTQPKWKEQARAQGCLIDIATDLSDTPNVKAEESALREVLINIIFNAVDAVEDNGLITFRTDVREQYVVLEVKDNGCGMDAEVSKRCLEPFFTTKKNGGTGMGLAMVKSIIGNHRGTLNIRSKPGKGTTVTIQLPIERGREEKKSDSIMITPVQALKILLVEDDKLVKQTIKTYLLVDNHTVEVSANGLDGLHKFRNGTFDVVITDKALPEINGVALAAEIKNIAPTMPVIMLTGFDPFMLQSKLSDHSIDYLLNKPVTLDELREALAKTVKFWQQK